MAKETTDELDLDDFDDLDLDDADFDLDDTGTDDDLSGDLQEVDQFAVAVVGTRRLTSYGRQVTKDLVTGLVHSGVTVVSGLARGIDSVAHKMAVDLDGRTIAVLGSGLDSIYPAEHRNLAKQIAGGKGALISMRFRSVCLVRLVCWILMVCRVLC